MRQKTDELDWFEDTTEEFDLSTEDLEHSEQLYDLTSEVTPKRAPTLPHCDCTDAAAQHGVFYASGHVGNTMYQVTTVDGSCSHCGHAVFYRTLERPNKNYSTSYGKNKGKREPKPYLMAMPDKVTDKRIIKEIKHKAVKIQAKASALPVGLK